MFGSCRKKPKLSLEYRLSHVPHFELEDVFSCFGLALNKSRNMFLVYGCYEDAYCFGYIFTGNGDLVTEFDLKTRAFCDFDKQIPPISSFSDDLIIVENLDFDADTDTVNEFTDSGIRVVDLDGRVLGVDEDGKYFLYQKNSSRLLLYSHFETIEYNLDFLSNNWPIQHFVVRNDEVFLFKTFQRDQSQNCDNTSDQFKSELKMYRYSLSTNMGIETTHNIPVGFNSCCMDDWNNVIIDFTYTNECCVCYADGRVEVLRFEEEPGQPKYNLMDEWRRDMLVTKDLFLIRAGRIIKMYTLLN